jgi:hypothetical protein
MNYMSKLLFWGNLKRKVRTPKAVGGSGGLLAQSLRFRCVAELSNFAYVRNTTRFELGVGA